MINCKISENTLKGLNKGNKVEITNLKDYLSKTLNPSQCKRVKRLQGKLSHLFEAYIGHRSLRLLFTINDNSHIIVIMDVGKRTRIFNPNR